MEWINYALSILSGLAVIIPLVIKLVEYVQKAVKEKNWTDLMELVMELMKTEEGKFETGEERKEFVIMALKASADTINYDIDLDVVSRMIDDLCAMSKSVNPPAEEAKLEK